MSDIPEDDHKLLLMVKKSHPSDYDRVMNLYGALAEAARPELTKVAKAIAYDGVSVEDLVSETIFKGFLTIHTQVGGENFSDPNAQDGTVPDVEPAKKFRFDIERGLSLKSWLVLLMKGTGAFSSGVARTHNRRMARTNEREAPLETYDLAEVEIDDDEKIENELQSMEVALELLPGRQKFILKTRFGLPVGAKWTGDALVQLAKDCGLANAQKLRTRAKRAAIDPGSTKLQMQQIEQLLDVSSKTVQRELNSALKELKDGYGSGIAAE